MTNQRELTRWEFVGGGLAAVVLSGMRPQSVQFAANDFARMSLYWGDLHNHNAVGYATGTLERSIDIAREHLDFFAFTGHASWHDMPKMPGDRHLKWVNGFKVHSDHWPKTRRLIQEANAKDFVSLLGYEWHSSQFGDYCIIFPEDQAELYLPDDVEKLLDFAVAKKALAIPHHVGYAQGWRGANFDHFHPVPSPVIELFSEHGCTETDRAPYPMIRHSNGGRSTSNTIVPQLQKGLRFGFVASSDNHRGYPGAYGEGLVGIWARDLSRAALFEAIRARRTYAVTGDRIVLQMSLNDEPMGAEIPRASDREIAVEVEAQDAIAMIELIRNGQVIGRSFPEDKASPVQFPGRAKCRVQYGWGPWAALGLGRTCQWDMRLSLDGGRFVKALPCFQSGPYEEHLRDHLRAVSERELHLKSFTSRDECYAEDPTKSLLLEIEGQAETKLTLHLRLPVEQTVSARLADLTEENIVTFTGGFTSESYIVNRLISPSEYSASVKWSDPRPGSPPDWYYVRVTQHNGQLAWSSPIWVG
jgi:hypothetical protein